MHENVSHHETHFLSLQKRADGLVIAHKSIGSASKASGSMIERFNCFISTIVSCLHFGQYRGKLVTTVSLYIFILVLLRQIGQ